MSLARSASKPFRYECIADEKAIGGSELWRQSVPALPKQRGLWGLSLKSVERLVSWLMMEGGRDPWDGEIEVLTPSRG